MSWEHAFTLCFVAGHGASGNPHLGQVALIMHETGTRWKENIPDGRSMQGTGAFLAMQMMVTLSLFVF